MIRAFTKAIAQLSDPPIRAVVWKSIAGTILIFVVLFIAVGWGLANTSFFEIGWIDTTLDLFGGLATVFLALILFPGIVSSMVSVFLEDIAEAVEARHYQSLGPARTLGLGPLLATTARLIGLTLVLNLLALPFYLIPGVNLVVFYGLNGYLLGREYFEIVALRRLDVEPAKVMRRQNRAQVWLTGAATTFLLSIPVVNMIAPVLGTAAMVHLFTLINSGR